MFQVSENLSWVFGFRMSLEKYDPVISRNSSDPLPPQGRGVIVHEISKPCDATEVVPAVLNGLISNSCLGGADKDRPVYRVA